MKLSVPDKVLNSKKANVTMLGRSHDQYVDKPASLEWGAGGEEKNWITGKLQSVFRCKWKEQNICTLE